MSLWSITILLFYLQLLSSAAAEQREEWDYVEVRPGAKMFWWLYYYDGAGDYSQKPLIFWLQGGPGAGSSGYGNFYEVGPLDINLEPRQYSWTSRANVVFIDAPVGSGYSYVQTSSQLTRNNTEIALDLVTFSSHFFWKFPELQKSPLYIFGESYGGKVGITYALELRNAVKNNVVKCNLRGVALIDAWISPMDYVRSWGPFLYATSLVDEHSLEIINQAADDVEAAINRGDYYQATKLWGDAEMIILEHTNGINFYNILMEDIYAKRQIASDQEIDFFKNKPELSLLYRQHVLSRQSGYINYFMNNDIKKKLNLPYYVSWGGQSRNVFAAHSEDFMKPVYKEVDEILSKTDLQVIVINGQLDLIVDTLGTNYWIQRLQWDGFKAFNHTERLPISITSDSKAGFVKSYKNLAYYYIHKSGHLVPGDTPEAAMKMLDMILFKNHVPF